MKKNSNEKLNNLEKAWIARQISESDYLMWKKVYSENPIVKGTGHTQKKSVKK